MKIKILLISTLTYCIISSLTACVGDVHCPAFPEKLKVFYPYEKGDTLKFVNTANDTLKLIIEELQMTKAYTFPENCDGMCGVNFGFTTGVDEKSLIGISGSIVTASLKGDYGDGGMIKCSIICEHSATYYADFTLSMDTITLTNSYNPGFVVIKKNVGIESFYDIENDCTWTKI